MGRDPDDEIYETLAKSILSATTERDVRHRVELAVQAIKRERPLLHPPDEEIIATLEQYVIRLRDRPAPLSSIDTFVSKVLDVSRLKTVEAKSSDE